MKKLAVIALALLLAGCAGAPIIIAETPRSVSVYGVARGPEPYQQAADLAQASCQKQQRHASLARTERNSVHAIWQFDCVN